MNEPDEPYVRPAFVGPHEEQELAFMLDGKKHLSRFSFEEKCDRESIFPKVFSILTS